MKNLDSLVRFARESSPFYRQLFDKVKFPVVSTESLPVLRQEDFWAANALDDNRLLTGPMEDGIILKSGGTTGKPKFSIFSRDEWSDFTQVFSRKLALNGLEDGDRVANLFYVGDLYGSFLFTHRVLEECPIRLLQLPIAGITPVANSVKTIEEYGATVIACLPTTLMSLVSEMKRAGGVYRVKKILFAGEPMQPDQCEKVHEVLPGASIRSIGYASNDAGLLGYADLSCGPSEFRCYDGEAVYEILDEESGFPISETGREGRAVVTNLGRRLMPIVRYPVGDRAVWLEPPGGADRKFLLLGRTDEAVRVASLSLYFDEIQAVLQEFSASLGVFPFQLVVVHQAARDGLVVRIGVPIAAADRFRMEQEILRALVERYPIYRQFAEEGKVDPIRLEWKAPSDLEINTRTGKLKRVIDLRKKC